MIESFEIQEMRYVAADMAGADYSYSSTSERGYIEMRR